MLRIVPHTVPRVGRSYEQFSDGFELHLLQPGTQEIDRITAVLDCARLYTALLDYAGLCSSLTPRTDGAPTSQEHKRFTGLLR